jgi:ribosomal protein L31
VSKPTHVDNRSPTNTGSTITQRFVMPSTVEGETCEVDVDADCRLCFFVEKKEDGSWKTHVSW